MTGYFNIFLKENCFNKKTIQITIIQSIDSISYFYRNKQQINRQPFN